MIATLNEVKTYLSISGTDDDTLLTSLLTQCSAYIKTMLGRNVEEATYTDDLYDDAPIIQLQDFPVSELTSITYNSGTLKNPVWSDVDANDYVLYKENGVLERLAIEDGYRNLKLTYTAGYGASDIPQDLRLLTMRLVSAFYNKRKSEGVSNESLENVTVQWGQFLSSDDKEVLMKHKLSFI